MKRIWIVAAWEFTATVSRPGFVGTVAALPLFHLAIGLLLVHSLGAVSREIAAPKPIVVVDAAHVLAAPRADQAVVGDEREALQRLRNREADAVFVLSGDYLQTGRLRTYSRASPGLFHFADMMKHRERAADLIREGLLASRPPDPVVTRALDPVPSLEAFTIDRQGRLRPDSGSPFAVVSGAFGVGLLLGLAIFMASGLLQQSMVAERQNRMLEVLLISVAPLPLLAGKVLALSAAGLIQVVAYLALLVAAAPEALAMVDVPFATLAWMAVCFLAGYLLYACLMAGTGALGNDTQQSTQIATVWMVAGALPLFFIGSLSADGTSLLARALTWFPLTAPVALLLRIATESVSAAELAGALGLTLVTAAAALVASAGLLRRVAIAGARSS